MRLFAIIYMCLSISAFSQKTEFSSPFQKTEHCHVPQSMPGSENFNKSYFKEMNNLCEIDFYNSQYTLCSKVYSTNPGLLLFEIKSGTPEEICEAAYQKRVHPEKSERKRYGEILKEISKKEAKFKQSTSCSYTPSILGYYHFSHYFDGIGMVPASVYRTLDPEVHAPLRDKALSLLSPDLLIYKTWKVFKYRNYENSPLLYTNNNESALLYGALSENPKGEEDHYAFSGWGISGYDQRVTRFIKTWAYQNLYTNPLPITKITFQTSEADYRPYSRSSSGSAMMKKYNPDYKPFQGHKVVKDLEGLKTVRYLKDMSDMMILDYLFAQNDRFGNIHLKNYLYSYTDGQLAKEKYKATPEQDELIEAKKAVVIPVMLLKDNDCGIRNPGKKSNGAFSGRLRPGTIKEVKKSGIDLIGAMKHINPITYKKLLHLREHISSDSMKSFLKDSLFFTDEDYRYFSKNVNELADNIEVKCLKGELHLDAGMKDFISGMNNTNPKFLDPTANNSEYCSL